MPALVSVGGCLNGDDPQEGRLLTRIQELEDKVEDQARLLAEKDEHLHTQAEIIQRLRELPQDGKTRNLVQVDRIQIERLSGGYDEDRNGIDEGVAVYLRMYDREGDTIKSAGTARVKLFDLANPPGQQLVGKVEVGPDELADMWYGRFLTAHYTLRVPFETTNDESRPHHPNITVLASFTDLLTGRSFEDQRVVKVKGRMANSE